MGPTAIGCGSGEVIVALLIVDCDSAELFEIAEEAPGEARYQ